jgi:D-alanyl-D-alanine carboxypeptidase/D-alanyl-D-alanine-endopeptidase (penicillin-binding protein 4)
MINWELYIMTRIHRFISILLLFICTSANGQNTIQSAVDLFSVDPNFANASISFMAMDCSTGQIIASKNPDLSLPPASTTKLWSTATAYQLLGKDYAPKTRIYIDGIITDSVLNGNLWIRGGGDIALGSRYYNGDGIEDTFLRSWSDSLKMKGIKKITGAIIADGSEFGYEGAPDGWAWGDMGNYYGAAGSGLPIYDNMLRYYFATGKTAGSSTTFLRTFPVVPGLTYHNYVSTGGSGDNSYIYGAPYSLDRFGTGTLQAGSSKFMVKGSLPDPELTFAQEFSRVLKEKGFLVSDSCVGVRSLVPMAAYNRYAAMTLLHTHVGKTLNSVAWWTNMKSVNTFAEEILCWVGYGSNGNGSIENSLDKEMDYWKTRINTSGLYLKDGSGLSRSNAISAQHFCNMLKYMTTSKEFDAFYGTLAVAGVSGTLSDVCLNQAGEKRVHAKSGTMKRIKSYAGYVETKSGKKLCFAIIVNNYNCSNETTLERIEKVMNAMALY